MKNITTKIKKKTTKALAITGGSLFGVNQMITTTYADSIDTVVEPYGNAVVDNIKSLSNIVGLVMLAIALLMLMTGNRDRAKEMAVWAVIGYIALQGIATIWGIISGVGI